MNESIEIDFGAIGKALLKRIWLIILCAVIVGAGTLIYMINFMPPKYQASVTFYVNNDAQNSSGSVNSSDLSVARSLANSYVKIIVRDAVLEPVIEELRLNMTPGQLRGMVYASVADKTEIFSVTVVSQNPNLSADVANSIARLAPDIISEIISGSRATPFEYAKVPTARSDPNYAAKTAVGALAGALIAILIILIQVHFDIYIKTEADIKRIHNIPVLGVIPEFDGMNQKSRTERGEQL